MSELRIETERLALVAATVELVGAELEGTERFAERLGARVESWPPPLVEEHATRWVLERLGAHPEDAGWFVWYVLEREANAAPRLAGMVGFKGPPDERGDVEIGYSILPPRQGRGFATEAVEALVERALGRPEVTRVTAQTLPSLEASIRVLEKCGFRRAGRGTDEEDAILFARTRS